MTELKLDLLKAQRKAILKSLAEDSLHEFVRQAWHLVEPDTKFRDNWHLVAICDHLQAVSEGKISRLLINVPPGTMKSLLVCVFWPAWEWTKKPGERYLFASYSDALSMRDSVRCRNILTSDWYQDKWPMKFRDDQNAKGMFENTLGGWRLATSVGGRGTGLHPGRVICDDGNSAAAAESEAERQNVIDWWDGTISTRGISRGVAQVVIQQRLHTQDMTGHLLGKDGWEHICLPMRYEPGRMKPTCLGFQDPRTVDGQLLWPELFTEEIVSRLEKTMGLYNAAGQLQQRPVPRGGGMFKREWFTIVEAAPVCQRYIRYWDKAGSAKGTGARTAGVLMGKTSDGRYVVLDVITARLEAPAREALIKQTAIVDAQRYNGQVTTATEQEPGSSGKEAAASTVKNLAGFDCRVDRVTGSKDVRAEPLAAQASVGNVFVLKSRWTPDFLDEIEVFPLGKLKDQCDAAASAFVMLCEASGAFSSVEKELPTMARDVGEHCFATGEDSFYSTDEPGSFLN